MYSYYYFSDQKLKITLYKKNNINCCIYTQYSIIEYTVYSIQNANHL